MNTVISQIDAVKKEEVESVEVQEDTWEQVKIKKPLNKQNTSTSSQPQETYESAPIPPINTTPPVITSPNPFEPSG